MLDRNAQVPRRRDLDSTKPVRALSRAEKGEATYRSLVGAAVKVVGACGYADAAIAKITQRANVAQGTFYNYFDSQQHLFDRLLPLIGHELIDRIRITRAEHLSPLDKELAGFRTFFDYLLDVPEFYRLLTEAETFAPGAHAAHMDNMIAGYVRWFARCKDEGDLADFEPREFEPLGYMLVSMRHYLAMRYTYGDGEVHRLPDWVVETYAKVLRQGLFRDKPRRRRASPAGEEQSASRAMQVVVVSVSAERAVAEVTLPDAAMAAVQQAAMQMVAVQAASALMTTGEGRRAPGRDVASSTLTTLQPLRARRITAVATRPTGAEPLATVVLMQHPPETVVAIAQIIFSRTDQARARRDRSR